MMQIASDKKSFDLYITISYSFKEASALNKSINFGVEGPMFYEQDTY
jgi:hypothetical protein